MDEEDDSDDSGGWNERPERRKDGWKKEGRMDGRRKEGRKEGRRKEGRRKACKAWKACTELEKARRGRRQPAGRSIYSTYIW